MQILFNSVATEGTDGWLMQPCKTWDVGPWPLFWTLSDSEEGWVCSESWILCKACLFSSPQALWDYRTGAVLEIKLIWVTYDSVYITKIQEDQQIKAAAVQNLHERHFRGFTLNWGQPGCYSPLKYAVTPNQPCKRRQTPLWPHVISGQIQVVCGVFTPSARCCGIYPGI